MAKMAKMACCAESLVVENLLRVAAKNKGASHPCWSNFIFARLCRLVSSPLLPFKATAKTIYLELNVSLVSGLLDKNMQEKNATYSKRFLFYLFMNLFILGTTSNSKNSTKKSNENVQINIFPPLFSFNGVGK